MAIFKAKVQSKYAQIPNSTAQDNRLSFEARGVLTLLLSMPDNWEVTKQWLCNQTSAGRDKIQRIINELIENGYIRKSQQRTKGGKFSANDMFVFAEPDSGLAVDGLAVDGKTDTTKETDIKNKQETNNGCSDDQPHTKLVQDGFDFFWKYWLQYKKSVAGSTGVKKEALAAWKKIYNKKYFANHSEKQFRDEVTMAVKLAEQRIIKNDSDFNDHQNLHGCRFIKRREWVNG